MRAVITNVANGDEMAFDAGEVASGLRGRYPDAPAGVLAGFDQLQDALADYSKDVQVALTWGELRRGGIPGWAQVLRGANPRRRLRVAIFTPD